MLNFLGGLSFAIMLISTTALFVIVGTFIESITQSHRYAALFTYSNPLFISLLAGFFINILLSALRRWPFKTHHIPFLITHLGLLMVIAGVIIKTLYGVQGNMGILEGTGSEEIFVPGSYVVQVEKYTPESIQQHEYILTKDFLGNNVLKSKDPLKDLDISIVEYAPHSEHHFETWIKNDHVYIKGFPAIPLNQRVTLPSINEQEPWSLLGTKSLEPLVISKQHYIDNIEVILKNWIK